MTEFIHRCDLCGSLIFELIHAGGAVTVRRCRTCSVSVAESVPHGSSGDSCPDTGSMFRRLMGKRRGTLAGIQVLVIGAPDPAVAALARGYGMVLSMHPGPVETAPFQPDQFDMIICSTALERLASPSVLFRNARRWLVPSGLLILGGANAGSLPALLRRRSWLRRHAPGSVYLVGAHHLKAYAGRFGFEVQSLHAGSPVRQVASVLFNTGNPSLAARILSAPLAMVTNAANLGDRMTAVCVKGGVALNPVHRRLSQETERDRGLAPALYVSAGGLRREIA